MFPAISLPSFEESTDPKKIDGNSIDEVFQKCGFVYSIGLLKQMTKFNQLSSQIFLELESDFDKLALRVENISSRVEQFKLDSQKVIEKNSRMDPQDFSTNQYSLNEMPKVESTEFMYNNAESFIQPLLDKAENPPTLEPFSSIIPNYKELDLQITDPSQFEKQYKEEMLAILKDFKRKLKKKMKKQREETEEVQQDGISSAVLHAYIETIQPPQQTLVCPPPPGMTANWRNYEGNAPIIPIKRPSKPVITAPPSRPKLPSNNKNNENNQNIETVSYTHLTLPTRMAV